MIETDINYPAGLPNPLRDGHALNPLPTFNRTRMASGRARNRRGFESVPTEGDWQFIFTDAQAMAFEAWFRDALKNGTEWFNIPRKTPLGMSRLVCRFTSMYRGPELFGRDRWRYVLPLEVWERPMLPPGWGNFPEFVLGASIIDIALNREWPEA